jgi:hypothetical protein
MLPVTPATSEIDYALAVDIDIEARVLRGQVDCVYCLVSHACRMAAVTAPSAPPVIAGGPART